MADPTPPLDATSPPEGGGVGGAPNEGAPDPVAPTEAGAASRRRKRPNLALRASVWVLVLAVLAAVAFLTQTGDGQRIVLERLLDVARRSLAGDLTVGDIRSRNLFTGMTLVDVRLDAENARRFLRADSVVVRYTPLSLLAGGPRISSTTLYGIDVEVSRYAEEAGLNVTRLLAPAVPDSASTTTARPIGLGRISVRGGDVRILTPARDAMAADTFGAETGEPLRRLSFEIEDLDVEETVVRPGGAVVLDARLTSFTASVHVLDEPLQIVEAAGILAFGVRGIELTETSIRLPGSLLGGDVRFGPRGQDEAWSFSADLRSDGWGDLADLQWIDDRVPPGRFRGGAGIEASEGLEVDLRGLEAEMEASRIVANGQASFDPELSLRNLRLTATPLGLAQLEAWVGRELPYDGFLSGEVTLGGTRRALSVIGRLTLVPLGLGGAATTADFSGTVHVADDLGATNLRVLLEPLNYRLLEPYWAGAAGLAGGRARLDVNGSVSEQLRVVADLGYGIDTPVASRWVGRGTFARADDGEWIVDLAGDLAPLSLSLFDRAWPEMALQGVVAGPVRAAGRLSDLAVGGELATGTGTFAFTGALDATAPASGYRLDVESDAWPLSDLTTRVPSPSVLTASLSFSGRGFVADSVDGSGRVVLRSSRVGSVVIDSATAVLQLSGGVLTADTMHVTGLGTTVVGAGSIGLVPGARGEAAFEVVISSLLELRPLLMGDSILVRDGLSALEQDLLRVRGIDPDTLPEGLDVRMAGAARGVADVRGDIRDFEIDLTFDASDVAYRHDAVDSVHVSLSASDLPATFGDWTVTARARGVQWADRQFEEVEVSGAMSERRGEGTVEIQRRRNERYFATGAFAVDSTGGAVDLREASAQINDLSWMLLHPAAIAWSGSEISVDSLELIRIGDDPMELRAAGTLTRGGDSNFRLELEGFHLEDALQIVQREDLDFAGHADLSLTVLGPSERPTISALFQIEDPQFGTVRLSRLSGSLDYRELSSRFRLDGFAGARNVVTAEGILPFDLALTDVESRSVDAPMDVRISADSLDAATALAYLGALRDVGGLVSADFRVEGTTTAPEPSGTVRLTNGAWTVDALGVRHEGVSGEVLLRPDRTLEVSLETRRSGTSTVTGFVTLEPLTDPALDLVVSFDRFQAVDRRDMEGMISGFFRLGGTYRLPVAEGTLRVDQGTLFVDEFARAAGIVDLTDPLLYSDGFAVDTTVFVSQPLLAGIRNPFLDNLRVDIDMSVPRDTWLRSDEMNVEMGGDLLVRYDRALGDLVLVGELEALRGSYVVLGRTFEVTGGTVAFLGQAGINPSLDIGARSRIRRRDGDPLEVLATVEGTLVQPLVSLSTEEAGLDQSDLISYLVFGRASAELGTGGAGLGGGFGQDIQGGLTSYAAGAIFNQIGAAVAQGIGLDYLAVSQGNVYGGGNVASNFLSTAQFELGRYLGEDVFVVLVLSRPDQASPDESGRVNILRGVRVEWALTDNVFVEGFVEDRLLRTGTGGLGASGLDGDKVVGLVFFREWGYGSDQ